MQREQPFYLSPKMKKKQQKGLALTALEQLSNE